MRKIATILTILLLGVCLHGQTCKKSFGDGKTTLTLATGSPGELGLLDELASTFLKDNHITLCWVKAGSGKSLSLLKKGEVDIVMVHAPKAEKKAVKDGWASSRTLLGSNEFYVVGPKDDKANIQKAKSVADAYAKIANAKALFYSRGDNSGTHKKELSIWKKAHIKPSDDWYKTSGDFMLATLMLADKNRGYFMTDSSTWYVGLKDIKNLKVLFRGDRYLINTYSALKPSGEDTVHKKLAQKFIDFLASKKAQHIFKTFGEKKYNQALYNDAEYAKQHYE